MESTDGDDLLLQKSSPKLLQALHDALQTIEDVSNERDLDGITRMVSTPDLIEILKNLTRFHR